MATRLEGDQVPLPSRRTSFADRYPDYPSWLDGSTWELDIETDIAADLNAFRSALHYQARVFGLKLATKTVYRLEDGVKRRYLLVRTY